MPFSWATWQRQSAGRAFVTSTRLATPAALAVLTLLLATAWAASYAAGGSHTALPHLFYLPIVLASARFSWRGALTCAVAAGVLAGPLLPAVVDSGRAQDPWNWLGRLATFAMVGGLVAWLTNQSRQGVVRRVHDARSAADLRRAVAAGEIVLHYQPVVDLATNTVIGVEALSRWKQPSGRLVPPFEFIPLAERTGVIGALGAAVLRTAVRQVRAWDDEDLGPLTMSVNVSAVQLADEAFVDEVTTVLEEEGVDPSQLTLEITETTIIADVGEVLDRLTALRGLGVRVAVDDFGTGQSSLSYLADFPVDSIKIDRSFVVAAVRSTKGADLVAGLTRLADSIAARTVVEGVETREQADLVRALGCRSAQGFFFARPMPADGTRSYLLRCNRRGRAASTRRQRGNPVGSDPS